MVRAKKEFVCSLCQHKHMKWEGLCRGCGVAGTLQEIVIQAATPKPRETASAKSLRRRSKGSERGIARRMTEVDGVDPAYRNIASSTGRIGFITGMRVDAVSLNYFIENKNRKIPTWMGKAWEVINQKAIDSNKHALLHIEPPNIPKFVNINGTKQKLDTLAIITQSRHEDLIRSEKALNVLLSNEVVGKDLLDQVYEILHPNNTD